MALLLIIKGVASTSKEVTDPIVWWWLAGFPVVLIFATLLWHGARKGWFTKRFWKDRRRRRRLQKQARNQA